MAPAISMSSAAVLGVNQLRVQNPAQQSTRLKKRGGGWAVEEKSANAKGMDVEPEEH